MPRFPHPSRTAWLAACLQLTGAVVLPLTAQGPPLAPVADTIPGTAWTTRDWEVFQAKVRWGDAERLDTLPLGKAIVALGLTFVGATYTPATLEVPGPERLVVNLRAFDCVTLIENVLALVRFIREDGVALLADPPAARARYERYLREWRYRGGVLDGYPSRLHYFSEWLGDNAARGRVLLLAQGLGGVADADPLYFMSAHPTAYRQLADPVVRDSIVAIEARLGQGPPRWFLREDQIRQAEPGIQDGDLIAAMSTLPGLDVAHTGIALWMDGRLHLLHAPLVGRSVEISELPLAERIRGIAAQDGVMVARVR